MYSKKIIYILVSIVLFIIVTFSCVLYQKIFGKVVTEQSVFYVRTNDDLFSVEKNLSMLSVKTDDFLAVAGLKNFSKPKLGRYVLKKGMSNNDIINMIRIGHQTPVKLSFNNIDTIEKLAGRISEQLEFDSTTLLNSLKDKKFLSKNNLNKKSVLQLFIPNTYEVFWTISVEKFRKRMLQEYNIFWNQARLKKAKSLKLTKAQVMILASIVQKETTKISEKPIVAGLYLNRLKRGWPLQADPTITYCIREKKGQNYSVKRVLTRDLDINCSHNTYKYRGLPPTLISMPDISSIEAVLNPKKHNYYYMCFDVDRLGYHLFARTLYRHNLNARKYHRWLNKKRIRR